MLRERVDYLRISGRAIRLTPSALSRPAGATRRAGRALVKSWPSAQGSPLAARPPAASEGQSCCLSLLTCRNTELTVRSLTRSRQGSYGGSTLVPGSGGPSGHREADLAGLTPPLLFRALPGGEGLECPTEGPWGARPSCLLQGTESGPLCLSGSCREPANAEDPGLPGGSQEASDP